MMSFSLLGATGNGSFGCHVPSFVFSSVALRNITSDTIMLLAVVNSVNRNSQVDALADSPFEIRFQFLETEERRNSLLLHTTCIAFFAF
jgi:hypothetical protein